MHIAEAAKKEGLFKKSYAALVTVVFDGEEYYLSELSQAGGALLQWKADRGDKAKMIMFTVVCAPDTVDDARHILTSVFENTPQMAEIAEGTQVTVTMIDGGLADQLDADGATPEAAIDAMMSEEPTVLAEFEI